MLTVRDSQMADMSAATGQPAVMPCQPAWIEFQLVDQDGEPVPGVKYKVKLPDGSLMTDALNAQGSVRFENIVAGPCQVTLPDIDAREWRLV